MTNKNKHNQAKFTLTNIAILMIVAAALGAALMWLLIRYDLSEWHHQVNRYILGLDYFLEAVTQHPVDIIVVLTIFIGGAWVYGHIQIRLFRLFHITVYRWTVSTVIGSLAGLLHLILAHLYWTPIYIALGGFTWWNDLSDVVHISFAPLFFIFALPVGIAQWWLLRKQFYYSWLWLLCHSLGSLVVGVIIYSGGYPDLNDPKLYVVAIGFAWAVASSFLWIIRHPRRGLLKAGLENRLVS